VGVQRQDYGLHTGAACGPGLQQRGCADDYVGYLEMEGTSSALELAVGCVYERAERWGGEAGLVPGLPRVTTGQMGPCQYALSKVARQQCSPG
jgi:hypothetical protein